ncbi:MAG TPA: hypothetical protein PKW23_05090 [Dictyoglomaceae bacterium]|nr:hypothetical protein [Dictyoglomaceae bacterium]HOL39532.1 hypothetical protein [Dictyoglomaceae bacterium]HOP94675.1 hypothetical protein [Dictyoglomaceae bacterium]HPP16089.1 hypothetical protein [Dictyoglomaceae bacterium]HPU43024.1 hypothetical protein [Dictyoglomaceae bacterium]
MRKINFDEHIKRKSEFTIKRLELERERLPRIKERNSEEWEVSLILLESRFRRLCEMGEIEKIGPRRWRIKV